MPTILNNMTQFTKYFTTAVDGYMLRQNLRAQKDTGRHMFRLAIGVGAVPGPLPARVQFGLNIKHWGHVSGLSWGEQTLTWGGGWLLPGVWLREHSFVYSKRTPSLGLQSFSTAGAYRLTGAHPPTAPPPYAAHCRWPHYVVCPSVRPSDMRLPVRLVSHIE